MSEQEKQENGGFGKDEKITCGIEMRAVLWGPASPDFIEELRELLTKYRGLGVMFGAHVGSHPMTHSETEVFGNNINNIVAEAAVENQRIEMAPGTSKEDFEAFDAIVAEKLTRLS
jgi:hypothetical protein